MCISFEYNAHNNSQYVVLIFLVFVMILKFQLIHKIDLGLDYVCVLKSPSTHRDQLRQNR